jgi:DNA-binding NarL/FixJ family response regulator
MPDDDRDLPNAPEPTGSVLSVLVVDDHPAFRSSARRLLESEGYVVAGEAEDGRSALEQAKLLDPDIVLLDIQLPDIDGFEVSRELKRAQAKALVILISSRDEADYGASIAECGARGFIPKGELSGPALARLIG